MKCRLRCEKPDEIEYTLTITDSAKNWESLRDQLEKMNVIAWPVSDLRNQINDLLAQARKIYWPKDVD